MVSGWRCLLACCRREVAGVSVWFLMCDCGSVGVVACCVQHAELVSALGSWLYWSTQGVSLHVTLPCCRVNGGCWWGGRKCLWDHVSAAGVAAMQHAPCCRRPAAARL